MAKLKKSSAKRRLYFQPPPKDELPDPAPWPARQTLVLAQPEGHDGAGLAKKETLIAENMNDSIKVFEELIPVHKQQVRTKGFPHKRPGQAQTVAK